MYKLLWKYFGAGLLKHYLNDHNKPLQLSQLMYAFTDSKGKKYYRFPENVALTFDRNQKLLGFLTMINARITSDNLKLLCDEALKIIQDGIGKDKNAAKVAALIYQIQERSTWLVPHQLVYDVLAVQYIREDESPDLFDNEIHLQKVDCFMNEISKNAFFLQMPELLKLFNMSSMSEKEWTEYCLKSVSEDIKIKELLRIYS